MESLILNGVALNAENLSVQSLTFTPAQSKAQWTENPDADGASLISEPNYTPSYFDMGMRVKVQESMDDALEVAGELIDALQSCARSEGGVPLEWLPKGATTTYTAYVLLGELLEVPTEMSGDLAGWLLRSPVAKIKLTCRPFLYGPEGLVFGEAESGLRPLQEIYVKDIGGDVPAEARMVVTDESSQLRRYLRFGREVVTSEENSDLLLTADDLTITGFAGSSTTRTGAFESSKVKRATAITQPTTIASTGQIENTGPQRVHGRVYATNESVRYRLAYRIGDGPLRPLAWQTPPASNEWAQIDFGEVTLDEAVAGGQSSELRVETKTTTGSATADLNYLLLIPTGKGMGTVVTRSNSNSTSLVGLDLFEQSEGNLAAKTANSGGTWAEAGDAVRFKVIAASDVARRTEKGDSSLNTGGAYALLGSSEPSGCRVSAGVRVANASSTQENIRVGVLLRYVDTSNWLMVVATQIRFTFSFWQLEAIKCVSGSVKYLGEALGPIQAGVTTTIEGSADAAGNWSATGLGATISGNDVSLAAGGTLAKGKVGIYDAYTGSIEGLARDFSNFNAVAAEDAAPVLYSGKSAEVRSDGYLRENSTGEVMGIPSQYRGARFFLDPDGGQGRINRIALMARRLDVTEAPDSNVTDRTSVVVYATPRFLAPR